LPEIKNEKFKIKKSMRNTIEAKLNELEVVEVRSPFQEVARGCLLNALGQIRTAEENLRYHEESQKASEPESQPEALAINSDPLTH
jgi:hypothetical protein